MTIKIGDRAVYLPRVPYGRQSELFCFVSRVVDAERGIVDIITFPADGELQRINNVMPKSDGVHVHCWVPREDGGAGHDWTSTIEALVFKLEQVELRLGCVERDMGMKQYAVLSKEDHGKVLAALPETAPGEPARRGPGRPRKDAAA